MFEIQEQRKKVQLYISYNFNSILQGLELYQSERKMNII